MIIAVIPARGGSKRIPRKNIADFCGKPAIAWSIEAAISAGCFDQVIVSTDDEEIAKVAEAFGANVPFRRPADLSDDQTPTMPVIRHAIDSLADQGNQVSLCCCIYATAPFVTPERLREGLRMLESHPETDFVFTAASFPYPIFRALKEESDGMVSMFWPEHEVTRSQDLPVAYHDAGQFYWGRSEAWAAGSGFFSGRSRMLELPRWEVQDIDEPEDWKHAELLFRAARGSRDE